MDALRSPCAIVGTLLLVVPFAAGPVVFCMRGSWKRSVAGLRRPGRPTGADFARPLVVVVAVVLTAQVLSALCYLAPVLDFWVRRTALPLHWALLNIASIEASGLLFFALFFGLGAWVWGSTARPIFRESERFLYLVLMYELIGVVFAVTFLLSGGETNSIWGMVQVYPGHILIFSELTGLNFPLGTMPFLPFAAGEFVLLLLLASGIAYRFRFSAAIQPAGVS